MSGLIDYRRDPLEVLSLYLNKSLVYTKQKLHSSVVVECSKGLRKIQNLFDNWMDKNVVKIVK